jgi:hypothetical protein
VGKSYGKKSLDLVVAASWTLLSTVELYQQRSFILRSQPVTAPHSYLASRRQARSAGGLRRLYVL